MMIYLVMDIFCWSFMVVLQNPKDLTCNFPIGTCHQFYATKFPTINTSKMGELSGISLGSTIPMSHRCLRWHSFILFLQRYNIIFNLVSWQRSKVSTWLLCFNDFYLSDPGGGHGNPLQYSCLENPQRQKCLGGSSLRVGHDWVTRCSTAQRKNPMWAFCQLLSIFMPTIYLEPRKITTK